MQLETVATVLSRRFWLHLFEQLPSGSAVAGQDSIDDMVEGGDGDLAGRADWAEQFQVASFDGAVEGHLQRFHVGHFVARQVDAVFGQ